MQTPQYAKSPQTQSHQALRHVGTNYGIVLFNLVPIDGTLTYRTIYNYNAKGQLERKQRLQYYDYWGDVGYEYDSSFVFGASGKIIRDSCNYYQDSYNKIIRQVAHKYSYDENGRLKKVDYEFYTTPNTQDGQRSHTQKRRSRKP